MDNISPLHPGINIASSKPNQSIIDALRDILTMAEDGRLQSFIGAGFTSDGLRISVWCDFHDDQYQMLGSIEWLKAEYIEKKINEE